MAVPVAGGPGCTILLSWLGTAGGWGDSGVVEGVPIFMGSPGGLLAGSNLLSGAAAFLPCVSYFSSAILLTDPGSISALGYFGASSISRLYRVVGSLLGWNFCGVPSCFLRLQPIFQPVRGRG